MLETASGDENCNQIVRRYGGPVWVKTGKAQIEHKFSGLPPATDIGQRGRQVRLGRVEDGRGSLGHSATLRFPPPLIEPDVPD